MVGSLPPALPWLLPTILAPVAAPSPARAADADATADAIRQIVETVASPPVANGTAVGVAFRGRPPRIILLVSSRQDSVDTGQPDATAARISDDIAAAIVRQRLR
jgi:hypothetical protein